MSEIHAHAERLAEIISGENWRHFDQRTRDQKIYSAIVAIGYTRLLDSGFFAKKADSKGAA